MENTAFGKSKKRKTDDAEKSLYSSFASAANAISALYAQAAQEQDLQRRQGAAAALERVLHTILRDYGTHGAVPMSALVEIISLEMKQSGLGPPAASMGFNNYAFGCAMSEGASPKVALSEHAPFAWTAEQQQQQQQQQQS